MALHTFNEEIITDPLLNANFTYCERESTYLVPIGAILHWAKTFHVKDSGTTTSTTANKLVEAGQNFLSTVTAGDCIYNTTDGTFAYVTAVDSNTTLSIDSDIMTSGDTYVIYATPALSPNFAECNGQVLSDAESRFNGATMPALNGTSEATKKFLRGALSSGGAASTYQHTHTLTEVNDPVEWDTGEAESSYSVSTESHVPPYYEVVMIMRIK